jgi:hypothetical protein
VSTEVIRGYEGTVWLSYGVDSEQIAEFGIHAWKVTILTQYQMLGVAVKQQEIPPGETGASQIPLLARPFFNLSTGALELEAHVDRTAKWFRDSYDWWHSSPWEGYLYLVTPNPGLLIHQQALPYLFVRGYTQNLEIVNHIRNVVKFHVQLVLDQIVLRLDYETDLEQLPDDEGEGED